MGGSHHPSNPKFKDLHDITATTYVTNFPTSLGTKELWDLCDRCGSVADVYIARKLSKNGRRFAFVRFLKVKNKESLIDDLNKIWIGSYHLFAAMARDVQLILNINNVLNKEGFCDFNCKYIGGMWLWIEFDSPEACSKFQNNKEMSWYFTSLKHINKFFVADERVIWIEIGGLPLNAWTSKAFKKIALNWGEPLFVDEEPSENNSIGRVCIKTRIHSQVNEICKVVILGKSFNVSVKEFAGWVPDIRSMESLLLHSHFMSLHYMDNYLSYFLYVKRQSIGHGTKTP
ncbi:DUF4283 domain protein [Artemisia annua]|uniref:DUF4283 domain protein n=1 Tax=Artemisia annua TaxID=35608 RepID=A0A2U1NV89_ARTAN|nr:DUF4283 domain protein [Artemisia annua]